MKTSGQATPKVVQKKIIPAKRSEVFDAWTKPEILRQWFVSKGGTAVSKNDLRVGGRYEHEINKAPGSNKADDCHLHKGEYLEIKPPEKLVFTWNTEHVKDTRVTVELRDLGESTELTLTHEFLPTQEQRDGHSRGWTECLNNLAALLSK